MDSIMTINEPIRTCNELGVAVDISLLDNLDLPLFIDTEGHGYAKGIPTLMKRQYHIKSDEIG